MPSSTLARCVCLAAVAILILLAPRVMGQCEGRWLYGPNQALLGVAGGDARINATTLWDPDGPGGQDAWLVVAGNFTHAGTVAAANIAAWNGSDWRAFGSGLTEGRDYTQVYALTVFNGDLIAGGRFEASGNDDVYNIARWDGSAWRPLSTGMNSNVHSLTVYDGVLIAGGWFFTAGGVSADSIARWDGASWSALDPGGASDVTSLTVYDGELIIAGTNLNYGGVGGRIARWNGTTFAPLAGC